MRRKFSMVQDKPSSQQGSLTTGPKHILRPPSPDEHRPRWLVLAWLASLLLHGALLLIMAPSLEKLVASSREPLQAELVFKPVVVTDPVADHSRPDKARYYADHDQSTKHEQKARSAPRASPAPAQRPGVAIRDPRFKAPTADDFLAHPASSAQDPLGLKRALGHEDLPTALPFSDHLPGVAEGDHSELNAWGWRHAPFFNRIKAQIGQVWAPNIQISRYDPQGALLGHIDRVTVVSVTIDEEGGLKELAVANSSGVAYLDEEAERAFKLAAPFPFPPKELLKGTGAFTFQFAFHLQVNRGMKFDFEWDKGS